MYIYIYTDMCHICRHQYTQVHTYVCVYIYIFPETATPWRCVFLRKIPTFTSFIPKTIRRTELGDIADDYPATLVSKSNCRVIVMAVRIPEPEVEH